MKKSFWTIWKLLTHAVLILAVMFGVFFVLDRFNPSMDFINSSLSKALLLVFALLPSSTASSPLSASSTSATRPLKSGSRRLPRPGRREAPSAAEQKDGPLPKKTCPPLLGPRGKLLPGAGVRTSKTALL